MPFYSKLLPGVQSLSSLSFWSCFSLFFHSGVRMKSVICEAFLIYLLFYHPPPGVRWLVRLPRAGANHLHGALHGAEAFLQDSPVAPFSLSTGRAVLLWSQGGAGHSDSPTTAHNTATAHTATHCYNRGWYQQVGRCGCAAFLKSVFLSPPGNFILHTVWNQCVQTLLVAELWSLNTHA